jgi:RNA polymerase sigma-70 factor (ECF subfamily)
MLVAVRDGNSDGGRQADRRSVDDLLARTQDGDPDAFGEFFDAEFDALLRWFTRRTADVEVAADLCAETFAETLTSLPRYRVLPGSTPAAWLYGIASHQLGRWHRRNRIEDRARRRMGIDVDPIAADELDLVELRADLERLLGPLERALERLSDAVREAVELRVVHELPYATVAARLGCAEGAARVRVSRGLAQLLGDLGGEG